jgi:hypothetical protein
MTSTEHGGFLDALLHSLDPHLGVGARKEAQAFRSMLGLFPGSSAVDVEKTVRSLKGIADLFPGATPSEMEKSVRTLLANAQVGTAGLAERAGLLLQGASEESLDHWLADVKKLKPADLKQLLQNLGVSFTGKIPAMPAMTDFLRKWVESGGQHRLPDPQEQLRARAGQYVGDLAERAKLMDPQTGQEILRAADAAFNDKALGVKGFEIFANLLGIPAKGTKAKMRDQVRNHVKTVLVSRQQTQF